MEAIHAGYAWLVGSNPERIVGQARELLAAVNQGKDFFTQANPFGDGRASERIAQILADASGKTVVVIQAANPILLWQPNPTARNCWKTRI